METIKLIMVMIGFSILVLGCYYRDLGIIGFGSVITVYFLS